MRIPNRYPTKCFRCAKPMAPGEGFVVSTLLGRMLPFCDEHIKASIALGYNEEQIRLLVHQLSGEQFREFYGLSQGLVHHAGEMYSIPSNPVMFRFLADVQSSPLLAPLLEITPEAQTYIESVKPRPVDCSAYHLYPFQEQGVNWLIARGQGAILADDMGCGKTVQALVAHPGSSPLLVVCPKAVKGVWVREARRWRPDLGVAVLEGRVGFRWPAPGEMIITTPDSLPEELLDPAPRSCTLILDEAHQYKNSRTKRNWRATSLTRTVRTSQGRVWLLTATPLMNRLEELWELLKLGQLQNESYGSLGRLQRIHNTPEGHAALKRVLLRRTKLEVLPELPKKAYDVIEVPIKLSRASDEVVRAAETELLEAGANIPFEKLGHARAILARAKIPFLEEYVEAFEDIGEPLVVFSCHTDPVRTIGARPGWGVIDGAVSSSERDALVDLFQAGKLLGLACTIRAGGLGITLTKSCNVLFVDKDWVPAVNWQAEDRVCRIGQTRPVNILSLVAKDSLDQRVDEIIMQKTRLLETTNLR